MPKLDASQFTAYFLIILAITSYIFGFVFDEDPGGGGKFKGDVNTIYSNLKIFLANDIYTASMHEGYMSSRIPGVYIFHKLFNPFVDTLSSYRKSVFAISFFLPILFFFCIRKKFKDTETTTLMINHISQPLVSNKCLLGARRKFIFNFHDVKLFKFELCFEYKKSKY